MSSSDVVDLVAAYAALRLRLAQAAATAAADASRGFGGWYDAAAITTMSTGIVRQVEPAQRQTASVTDAYLVRVLAAMTGRRPKPTGLVRVAGLRTGVAHTAVYGRLADQYRYEASIGTDPAVALDHVVTRAELLAQTDTDLAFRAQVHAFFDANKVTGYRRVVRPELSAGGSCGLCVAAADRVYKRSVLMPLHARCKCVVLPVIGDSDPGKVLNDEDIAELYRRAGSTNRRDLVKVRYTVEQHGELGPQLRAQGQHFRGPDDIVAAA